MLPDPWQISNLTRLEGLSTHMRFKHAAAPDGAHPSRLPRRKGVLRSPPVSRTVRPLQDPVVGTTDGGTT